jgi:molybdopterin adenylyltransferase
MTADKTSPAKIGIVTVSDRASAGVYKDLGGPAIHEYFTKHLANQ